MLERIWEAIKLFFLDHAQHAWLEQYLLYFFIGGLIILSILSIIITIKTFKDIKKLDKEKRKITKQILKKLSNKKNKL